MSGGGIIGAVVGGVIGFFIGGPMGAVYGASLGFAAGSYLDPMTPDAPVSGDPAPEEAVMKSTVGDPCPDLCGSAKIIGHLLLYGKERSEPVYAESQAAGGKGGAPQPQAQISGYDYYMSWALGICAGTVAIVHAIYKNEDELLWEGPLYLPASGGQESIVIDDFGTIEFYFGTDDQIANSSVGEIIGDATLNSPLRYFCWAFCDDCKIGNYPRTPTLKFVVTKVPEVPYSSFDLIQKYDAYPLASVYYALNTLAGLPSTWFDEDDFLASDTTLRDEFRGVSVLFKDNNGALSYIKNILDHVDCVMRYGNDGKFHPKLIRDDYDVDTIPAINEDDMLDDPSIIRKSWIGTNNEIKVQYSEIIDVERPKEYYGSLYYFGENSNYNVHSGSPAQDTDTAALVPGASDWKVSKIVAGQFFFKDDGLVYVRGNNSYGRLGVGEGAGDLDAVVQNWLQPIVSLNEPNFWQDFDLGRFASIGLATDGKVYMCGRNGTAKYLNTENQAVSFDIHSRERDQALWNAVAMGGGANQDYRFAMSNSQNFSNPYTTPTYTSQLAGGGDQYNYCLGFGVNQKIGNATVGLTLTTPTNLLNTYAGGFNSFYTAGVESQFEIYSCGLNNTGVPGVDSLAQDIQVWTLVPGGPWKLFDFWQGHCIAVKTDGTLWVWGGNSTYQLGLNDTSNRNKPTQVTFEHEIKKVAVNGANSYVLTTEGHLYCTGRNDEGEAGVANGKVDVRVFTRESSEGIWYNIWPFANGCFLIE